MLVIRKHTFDIKNKHRISLVFNGIFTSNMTASFWCYQLKSRIRRFERLAQLLDLTYVCQIYSIPPCLTFLHDKLEAINQILCIQPIEKTSKFNFIIIN